LDQGDCNIKKFDSTGKYINTFSRKGQGPGELEYGLWIQLDDEGNIYLCDEALRLLKLSSDGDYLGELKFPFMSSGFSIISSDEIVLNRLTAKDKKNLDNSFLLHFMDFDGNLLESFCKPLVLDNYKKTRTANRLLYTNDSKGNIYVTFRKQNRIEKYSSKGKLLFKADRPLNYKVYFRAGCFNEIKLNGKIIRVPSLEYSRVSGGIGVDNQGRIWVLTFKKQIDMNNKAAKAEDYLEFEVFDNNGILISKLPFPVSSFATIKICNNRLFIIDSHENACVYEYKIVNK